MKTFLILTFCLLVSAVQAQERTATGPLQTEASWAALKSLSEQANTTAKTAHIRLNQMDVCAKEGKLYSPSIAGADEHGCIAAYSNGNYMLGTQLSLSPAPTKSQQVTLQKTSNMVVRVTCQVRASASHGSYGSSQLQFFVGSKLALAKSTGCSASYGNNTNTSCSASGTFNFMEEDGILYAFDDVQTSVFGASLIGKRTFMNAAEWNGVLRASNTKTGSTSCSIYVDRTKT